MTHADTDGTGESCQGPNPELRKPRLVSPPGATDTHLHFFGPEARYAYVHPRKYTPPDASPAQYRELARTLGIERAVMVQASIYGTDNRRQLDAARELREMGIATRVVVVVESDTSDREFQDMHAQGARAVRFVASQPGGVPLSALESFSDRLHDLGWHIELMLTDAQLLELEPRIAKLRCRTVIDHMGSVQAALGTDQPAFKALRRLVVDGRWVKLSAAYRLSQQRPPYSDLVPLASQLVKDRPDRLVWGSDWPQGYFSGYLPPTADMLDTLLDWAPDASTRERILVANPAELYGF